MISIQSIWSNKVYQWILVVFLLFSSGFALSSPISWDELTSPEFVPRRSQEGTSTYLNFLAHNQNHGCTPELSVLMGVFGLSLDQAQACLLYGCPLENRLAINSFSYWLEPNIIQLIAFSNDTNWGREELLSRARGMLEENIPELFDSNLFEYHIYINQPENRSVKKLSHSHIFIRSKDQGDTIYSLVRHLPFSVSGYTPKHWNSP